MNLSKEVKLLRHSNAVAAGTSDITPSAGVDTKEFEGCMFVVEFGEITADAVTSIKVQQSDDNGVADAYSDLAGTAVAVADSADNKVFYVDIYRPRKRYLKLIVDRATQNAVLDSILALLYGPRKLPTTHDSATVGGGETHASPDEGTA